LVTFSTIPISVMVEKVFERPGSMILGEVTDLRAGTAREEETPMVHSTRVASSERFV